MAEICGMQQFHVINRDGLEDGVVSFNSSLFFVYRKPTVTHSANITVLLLLLSKMVCRLLQSSVAYHMFIFILYWYCTFRLRSFSSITFIRCFDDKVLLSHRGLLLAQLGLSLFMERSRTDLYY